MTARTLRSTDDLDALESEWDGLLQKSSANSFFMSWAYLRTWWEFYGTAYSLRLIEVRNPAGTLIGLAPLIIGRRRGFPRRFLRHLSFMGGLGDCMPEAQDFIMAPEHEDALRKEFQRVMVEELAGEWDLMDFRYVPRHSGVMSALTHTLERNPANLVHSATVPSPWLKLPETWEELLEGRSKALKKGVKNKWNRLYKRHEVRILEAGKDLSMDDAFEVLMRLHDDRWGADSEAFHSDRFIGFHRKLADVLNPKGQLYFRVLELDGKPAAVRFDFIYGSRLLNYQGGWDPEYQALSLGILFIGAQMQWCIEQGLKEYDFLAVDSAYKQSWSSDSQTLANVQIGNPSSWRASLFGLAKRVKGGARPTLSPGEAQAF